MEAQFIKVATLEDLPEGASLQIELEDMPKICLANSDGEIYAIADRCTHADFPMHNGTVHGGATIECAWHGARYDMATGKPLRLPAMKPIKTYEVKIDGNDIYIAVD